MSQVRFLVATIILVLSGFVQLTIAQSNRTDDLQRAFKSPPDEARIMMRWWWLGPAVTKPELEREMRLLKEDVIGGSISSLCTHSCSMMKARASRLCHFFPTNSSTRSDLLPLKLANLACAWT